VVHVTEFDLTEFDVTDVARGEPSMLREICALAARCSPDEQEALLYILRRIDKARGTYGALDLDSDERDWTEEIRQEMADATAYHAFRAVVEARRR